MATEPQVSSDFEEHPNSENCSIKDDDSGVTSSPNNVTSKRPAKKPTRQWAAWTRQEEASFFTALRQVGKNFEKITCRVQSKNKDQVRHYYYRLVRRMNKLLGPGFCLDAKNTKETIAAMLRWWSLLEKYSCKASKLHLKPRRFKIFIEALEHQLLKDRKKKKKKRPQVENCSTSSTTVSNQSRTPGHDTRAVKLVVVDNQNNQKLGSAKGSSLKRNINMGVVRGNSKGDLSTVKTVRQRQRRKSAGSVSSAAYKRWEKAAIAGVSLVADAAAQLEQTDTVKEVEHDQGTLGHNGSNHVVGNVLPLSNIEQNLFVESNLSLMKLKLQLFPIDDATRRALEMDKHNPHLELTLSNRKKISSVLEHLNRKWGNSSIASGELMLFPYSVLRENLAGHPRWTQDSVVSAADVHAIIGSPAVFRLRYGWISNTEVGTATSQPPLKTCCIPNEHNMNSNIRKDIVDSLPISAPPADYHSEIRIIPCKDKLTSLAEDTPCVLPSSDVPDEMIRYTGRAPDNTTLESSSGPAENMTWHRRETGNGTIMRPLEDADDLRFNNSTAISAGEWADSLTNISIGDLLSEVSHGMATNYNNLPITGTPQCLQQIPFSCDSFDAAIAAHISRTDLQPALPSHTPSILDADVACDEFSFQKNSVISSPGAQEEIARTSSVGSGALVEDLPDVEGPMDNNSAHDDPMHDDLMNECDLYVPDNTTEDLCLTDIYWPDSLGPLDFDIPSSRYNSEDLIIPDSLNGLNRLIVSSLDAFQNCSFFGLDKKEAATPTLPTQGPASFADFKIGSGV